ncbi:MAG: hypothetical protein ACLU38_12340 [Dysosmobacter sp.]
MSLLYELKQKMKVSQLCDFFLSALCPAGMAPHISRPLPRKGRLTGKDVGLFFG